MMKLFLRHAGKKMALCTITKWWRHHTSIICSNEIAQTIVVALWRVRISRERVPSKLLVCKMTYQYTITNSQNWVCKIGSFLGLRFSYRLSLVLDVGVGCRTLAFGLRLIFGDDIRCGFDSLTKFMVDIGFRSRICVYIRYGLEGVNRFGEDIDSLDLQNAD